MSHFCFVRHFFALILVMKTCPLSILPNKCSYQINVGFKAAAFQFNLTQVHHHEQEVCCLNKSCFSSFSFCNEYVAAKKSICNFFFAFQKLWCTQPWAKILIYVGVSSITDIRNRAWCPAGNCLLFASKSARVLHNGMKYFMKQHKN